MLGNLGQFDRAGGEVAERRRVFGDSRPAPTEAVVFHLGPGIAAATTAKSSASLRVVGDSLHDVSAPCRARSGSRTRRETRPAEGGPGRTSSAKEGVRLGDAVAAGVLGPDLGGGETDRSPSAVSRSPKSSAP